MSGKPVHLIQEHGRPATYDLRRFKAEGLRELRQRLGGGTFVDTTNMFIKTFADVAVGELGAGAIAVVRLRRDPVAIARSARRLGWFDDRFRSLAWPEWHLNPTSPWSSCAAYGLVDASDPVSLIVGHIVSCELDGQAFAASCPDVRLLDVDLMEIQSEGGATALIRDVGLQPTPATRDVVSVRLNERDSQKRRRAISVEPDLAQTVRDLLAAYVTAGAPVERLLR